MTKIREVPSSVKHKCYGQKLMLALFQEQTAHAAKKEVAEPVLV